MLAVYLVRMEQGRNMIKNSQRCLQQKQRSHDKYIEEKSEEKYDQTWTMRKAGMKKLGVEKNGEDKLE